MPSNIEAALNGLVYRSLEPNILDTINITLYDGENGDCLDISQLGTGSSRFGCLTTSITFQINVMDLGSVSDSKLASSSELGFKIKIIAGCIISVLLLGIVRCCYLGRLHRLKIK